MAEVLRQSGLVGTVEVVNSPGAGGAIGLAQFVSERGKGNTLLVGGLVMISAIHAQHATVSLREVTPVARLTGEYEVIAVPAASDILDLEDLVRAIRINPGSVTWGGGSSGGVDQQVLTELARATGVDPMRMDYVAFSGGGEVREALLARRLTAAVSGYGELAPAIESGRVRALGISSLQRLPGVLIQTMREQGVPVTFVNWRGVFAPPGLEPEKRQVFSTLIDQMVHTAAWRETLRRNRWTDLYLPSDAFEKFLRAEERRAARAPDPRAAARAGPVWTTEMWFLRHRNALALAVVLALACVAAFIARQRVVAEEKQRQLRVRLQEIETYSRERDAKTKELLVGIADQIDRQFAAWVLSEAEREIAMLMLKGFRHKEIAAIRHTSERTVRQQALSIYRKANLEGRSELVAFFLTELLGPSDRTIVTERANPSSAG
jgi:putative tricarboxylic transport membrane protein